jgi:hypothetical protein
MFIYYDSSGVVSCFLAVMIVQSMVKEMATHTLKAVPSVLFLFCFAKLTGSCVIASPTEAVVYHSVALYFQE